MDGPAIFDNVKGCHISVAAQQLQVRGSGDSEFAVYSANKPTIEHSTGLPFTFAQPIACFLKPGRKQYRCSSAEECRRSERGVVSLERGRLAEGRVRCVSCRRLLPDTKVQILVCARVQSCASRAGWAPILDSQSTLPRPTWTPRPTSGTRQVFLSTPLLNSPTHPAALAATVCRVLTVRGDSFRSLITVCPAWATNEGKELRAQVHDVSAEDNEGPNFDLLDAVEYWEVPIEGGPPPDNPVPGANGARYSPPAGAPVAEPVAAEADLFTENGGGFGGPVENGHAPMVQSSCLSCPCICTCMSSLSRMCQVSVILHKSRGALADSGEKLLLDVILWAPTSRSHAERCAAWCLSRGLAVSDVLTCA